MARVNITVPDDLFARAKAQGLNVSRVSAAALAEELDRLTKIEALGQYLAELEAEHGPIPDEEMAAARAWVGRELPGTS